MSDLFPIEPTPKPALQQARERLDALEAIWSGSDWDWGSACNADLFQAAHATARQRAEAFLRTTGKWKE